MLRLRSRIVLLALLAGCGEGGSARNDAGAHEPELDASASVDGGGAIDGGPVADAGPPPEDGGAALPRCETASFTHDGAERTYILCVPDPLPAGPLPFVLGFHGGGGNAQLWQRSMPWEETGAREGFGVVFMQGCRDGQPNCARAGGSYLWNVGKPGGDSSVSGVDDAGYTLAVIDRLSREHGLTVGPLFATGHSLGGIFSYSLRCDHPDVFAAIGPVSAPPSDATCDPRGDTSIYHVHGADDANVPFVTGCCSAAQQTPGDPEHLPACDALPRCFNAANWWPPVRDGAHPFADVVGLEEMATRALGCDAARAPIPERPPCVRYEGCRAGTAVEECMVDGATHSLAMIDAAFDVRAYLWERFRSHL